MQKDGRVKLYKSKISEYSLVNLEIDLMRGCGFTLVLCVLMNPKSQEPIKEFLTQTIKKYPFVEIHFNLEFAKIDSDISKYEDVLKSIYEKH